MTLSMGVKHGFVMGLRDNSGISYRSSQEPIIQGIGVSWGFAEIAIRRLSRGEFTRTHDARHG
eukprot:4561898-Prorocentrum_lima.AAC.1